MAILFRSRSARSFSILNLQWHCQYDFFNLRRRNFAVSRKPKYAASRFFTSDFWGVNFIRVDSNVLLFSHVGFLQQSCRWSWHRLGLKHGWRARPQSSVKIRQSGTFLFPTSSDLSACCRQPWNCFREFIEGLSGWSLGCARRMRALWMERLRRLHSFLICMSRRASYSEFTPTRGSYSGAAVFRPPFFWCHSHPI